MAIADQFGGPATKAAAITASDSTDLTGTRGIYVGGTGNIAIRCIHSPDTTVTLNSVPAGVILPIQVTRVMAATTATNLVALY